MNKKLPFIIVLLSFFAWSCTRTPESVTKEIAWDNDIFLFTDTIVNEADKFLYFDNLTDSTYLLVWGGLNYTNVSADTMPVLPNGKLYLDWIDKDAICVRQGCGTACFFAYILPLQPLARETMYFYPIDYDIPNHLVAYSPDLYSTIIVENFLTQKRYPIAEPVKGPLGSFGLDSTSFQDKKLFIQWRDENYTIHSTEYQIAD